MGELSLLLLSNTTSCVNSIEIYLYAPLTAWRVYQRQGGKLAWIMIVRDWTDRHWQPMSDG